jgi:hypothetical protein
MEYLDSHPEVSAYIAPCAAWDEVHSASLWNAYKGAECDFSLTHQGKIDLFNFIIEKHIWPEHIVYRTPVTVAPRTRAYWCFTDLIDLLERGTIHFGVTPFYRNLIVHPVGEREQLGNVMALTCFDEYRAGLEVLAYGLFGEQPYACRHMLQEMISAFICTRMALARELYKRQGNTLEAEMLRKRIEIANPSKDAVEKAA